MSVHCARATYCNSFAFVAMVAALLLPTIARAQISGFSGLSYQQQQLLMSTWTLADRAKYFAKPTPLLTPYTAFTWNPGSLSLIRVTCTNDPTSEGVAAAPQLLARPVGQRVILLWQSTPLFWGKDSLPGSTQQSPWMVNGAKNAAAWMTAFCTAVKSAGASIDYITDDDEGNLSLWGNTEPQMSAIAADPRFAPIALAYGLSDVSLVENLNYFSTQGQAWNAAIAGIINGYFRTGLYTPLNAIFPSAGLSNFADFVLPQAQLNNMRDCNGWPYWYPEPLVGTHQAPAFYAQIGQLATRNDGTNPNFLGSPMPTICWEATQARVIGAGSGHPSIPWFAYQSYSNTLANNQGYQESIFHVLMALGTTNVMFWNPAPATDADNQAMNSALAQFKTIMGGATSWKCLSTSPVPFNSTTITTSVMIGTRTVTRVSSATAGEWLVMGH